MPEITRMKPSLDEEENYRLATGESPVSSPAQGRITKETEEETPKVRSGWARKQRPRSTGVQLPRFSVPDDGEEVIIKFLDDEPFAAYFVHWLMTDNGRRPFTCAGFKDCPLCARGDKPKSQDLINLVNLSGDKPELQVWTMTADPAGAVEERATGKRTSPVNKSGLYFSVSKKKGSNGFFSYSVDPAKDDELQEDWGIAPLTDAQIAEFNKQKFGPDVVRIHNQQELNEATRYLTTD